MTPILFNKQNARVVAHRGLSGLEVENTAAAFVAAGNRSYYGVETDIYRTADGRFVILHDGNLHRMAGENLSVETVTSTLLEQVVYFDRDGKKGRTDLRPCFLEDYLNICKKYDKHCVLELKSDFTPEEIERMIEIIKEYDYLEHLTFISFNYENLRRVRAVLPTQSAQFLFGELNEKLFELLVNDRIDIDVMHTKLTPEWVDRAHKAGLTVNCWTVDDPARAEQLAAWQVDFITSNILE